MELGVNPAKPVGGVSFAVVGGKVTRLPTNLPTTSSAWGAAGVGAARGAGAIMSCDLAFAVAKLGGCITDEAGGVDGVDEGMVPAYGPDVEAAGAL